MMKRRILQSSSVLILTSLRINYINLMVQRDQGRVHLLQAVWRISLADDIRISDGAPPQTTLSPKEAFSNYPESADFSPSGIFSDASSSTSSSTSAESRPGLYEEMMAKDEEEEGEEDWDYEWDKKESTSFIYSCPDCTCRFETLAVLQKHRRSDHPEKQSGHKGHLSQRCERINPSTGKPCNRIFSRSYDLVRHEATIHAPKKIIFTCDLCNEVRTFSRQDALVRHRRVKHSRRN